MTFWPFTVSHRSFCTVAVDVKSPSERVAPETRRVWKLSYHRGYLCTRESQRPFAFRCYTASASCLHTRSDVIKVAYRLIPRHKRIIKRSKRYRSADRRGGFSHTLFFDFCCKMSLHWIQHWLSDSRSSGEWRPNFNDHWSLGNGITTGFRSHALAWAFCYRPRLCIFFLFKIHALCHSLCLLVCFCYPM